MIFFDVETTGLPKSLIGTPLSDQPEIVEFAAIKIDADYNELERIEFLCKPQTPITPELTKIHGIDNDMVADKKDFSAHYKDLCKFFLGESRLVAHNIRFDIRMLNIELLRLNLQTRFPWPPIHKCTLEMVKSSGKFGKNNLGFVYKQLFGVDISGAHRAINDVEALIKVYKEIKGCYN